MNCFFTSAKVHCCRGLFNVVIWLVNVGWWILWRNFTLWVGVGVNRSYTQILESTNFPDVFLYKKAKSKRIFWFYTFFRVCTPKNSGTRHSAWEKIINFFFLQHYHVTPHFIANFMLSKNMQTKNCCALTVKLSMSINCPWKMLFSKKFHPFLQF